MIDIQAMFPVMVATNLEEVKQFYTSAFGFNAVFYDADFYLHLVSNTGVQLGFLLPDHPSQPEFLQPLMSPDGYVISLEVADAAKAYAEAQSMELPIVMELKEEAWGQIHFIVEDPAGFKIDIVEHLEAAEK